MAEITAQMVKSLREQTGAGMMDCKVALTESAGDFDKAVDFLRKKGLKNVGKRSDKVAAEGVVFSYIHAGDKIGVMIELNCETDFVARGDEFKSLARDIAMHIAWSNPKFTRREEVPQEAIDREMDVLRSQLKPEQEKMAEKILSGRIEKFFEDNCLVDQIDVREPSGKKKIQDILNDLSAKIGEKIAVRRFMRFEVGEGIEKQTVDYAKEVAEVAGLS